MSLLAPAWLLLGALTIVILILHMRRRRQFDVPSVILWRLLENAGAQRRRLRVPPPSLVLLLQLLIVGLVAFALAQPLLGMGGATPTHTIYVLDASGSMRATDQSPTRFDAARAWLTDRIQRSVVDPGNRVSVVTAGTRPAIAVARQSSASGIVPMVEQLRSGDGSPDWSAVAAALAPLVHPGETSTVIVVTDGSDAAEAAIAEALPGLSVEQAIFAGAATPNRSLQAEMTPVEAEEGRWRVEGSVVFSGVAPVEQVIAVLFQPEGSEGFLPWTNVRVDGPGGQLDPVPAPPEVTLDVEFDLDLELPGPGMVLLRLPDDAGPHDNELYFPVRREPAAARVLYLGETSLPMIAALQAIDEVEVVAADALPDDDRTFDLVVVDGVTVPRRPATNVLWLGSGRIAGESEPQPLSAPYVSGWDDDHPLSDQVDWTGIAAERAYRVPRLPGAAVLAESSGAPLVQARTVPTGREIRLSFDLAASGWSEQAGFPVFIGNLLVWLGIEPGAVETRPCRVGEPCPIEARLLSGRILDPDGGEAWRAGAADAEFLMPDVERGFVPDRAGLYRLEAEGEARLLPVNAAPGEASLAPRDGVVTNVGDPAGPNRIWWRLLAAAGVLLLIETIAAGRGSEQFLRPAALASGNPLALRRRLQLGVRLAAIVFLVAALAGLPWIGRESAEDVVVAVGTDLAPNQSNPDRERLLAEVRTRLGEGASGAGLVAIGADNRIAADLGGRADPTADPLGMADLGTNLERAVSLAAAMLPADRAGRVVLASDGNETEGDVGLTLAALRARGVAVDVAPVTELPPGEVLVESVSAPSRVYAGDSFTLNAIVYSQAAKTANVAIRRADEMVLEQAVDLLPGRNRVETVIPAGEAGDLLVEVTVAAAGDHFAENNANGALVEVSPPPSVLVVAPDVAAGQYFAGVLGVQGLTADVVLPASLVGAQTDPNRPAEPAWRMEDWLGYDSVVLLNMPAIAIDREQQENLQQLVEVHGRGLLILGGDKSFGLGAYFDTPLEQMSPLSSSIPHEKPSVALVFVIDRSGSMRAAVGDVNRLDIAKQATVTAAGLLDEEARVGVVVFDSQANAVVPLQERVDQAAMAEALANIVPGGGTEIFDGLATGIAELEDVEASTRHIVLLTDGLTAGEDYSDLVREAAEAGITISAVAIGGGADAQRLESIATLGGGTFYATQDVRALPGIFAQEVLLLSKPPFQDRLAEVTWADRSQDFLAGLPEALPPVHDYILTTLRPGADLHMSVADEAGEAVPLLASWRVGNGRVLALATHAAGSGTQEWAELAQYPLIWSQAIRHFLPDTQKPGLEARLDRRGDSIRVVADYLDAAGAPIGGRAPSALVSLGAGAAAEPGAAAPGGGMAVALEEVAPGRYEGSFPIGETGTYRVDLKAGQITDAASIHVAYPARFDFGRSDFDKLRALAAATGGKLLLGDEPIFGEERRWVAAAGWPIWAVVALALFMIDLTIRHAPGLFGLRRRSRAATNLAVPA